MHKAIKVLAKVSTKSNFMALNDTFLPIDEMQGNRVTCLVYDHYYQKYIKVDFHLSEIIDFKTTNFISQE
jgi:hypothetical protein